MRRRQVTSSQRWSVGPFAAAKKMPRAISIVEGIPLAETERRIDPFGGLLSEVGSKSGALIGTGGRGGPPGATTDATARGLQRLWQKWPLCCFPPPRASQAGSGFNDLTVAAQVRVHNTADRTRCEPAWPCALAALTHRGAR